MCKEVKCKAYMHIFFILMMDYLMWSSQLYILYPSIPTYFLYCFPCITPFRISGILILDCWKVDALLVLHCYCMIYHLFIVFSGWISFSMVFRKWGETSEAQSCFQNNSWAAHGGNNFFSIKKLAAYIMLWCSFSSSFSLRLYSCKEDFHSNIYLH